MNPFKKLNKQKIQSWGDLDPGTANELMKELEKKDYRIFPFQLHAKDRAGNIIETINWALPYSTVRERLLKCPHCRDILVRECMNEIERIDILNNLTSKDPVVKDMTEDSIKVLKNIYDVLNPPKQPEAEHQDSGKQSNRGDPKRESKTQ